MDLTSVRRGFCFSVYILLSIFPFSSEKNKNDFVLPLLPLVSPANSLIYFLFSHTEVFFADFTTTWQCSQCFLWCWVLFKRRMKCKIFLPLPDQYLKWKAGQTPSKQRVSCFLLPVAAAGLGLLAVFPAFHFWGGRSTSDAPGNGWFQRELLMGVAHPGCVHRSCEQIPPFLTRVSTEKSPQPMYSVTAEDGKCGDNVGFSWC